MELCPSLSLWMTLNIFQGHNNIKQLLLCLFIFSAIKAAARYSRKQYNQENIIKKKKEILCIGPSSCWRLFRILLNLGHSPNWCKTFRVWLSWSPFSNAPKPSSLTQVMVDLPGLMILVSVLECFASISAIHPSDVRPSLILLSLILVSVPECFSSS